MVDVVIGVKSAGGREVQAFEMLLSWSIDTLPYRDSKCKVAKGTEVADVIRHFRDVGSRFQCY